MVAYTVSFLVICAAGPLVPDERPGSSGEWGFRPREGTSCVLNPPAFVVRLQPAADRYQFAVARDPSFKQVLYQGENTLPCHCAPRQFPPGTWYWRFRFRRQGQWSGWGKVRSFHLDLKTIPFSLPERIQFPRRIPAQHPRLLIEPTGFPLTDLKELAAGAGQAAWSRLLSHAEKLIKNPPSTEEPPRYPPGIRRNRPEWRALREGAVDRTVQVLKGAATLGFVWLVTNDAVTPDVTEPYAQAGKKLLLAASEWDPLGSTHYRYNDEAAIEYIHYFSQAYTFLYTALSDEENRQCQRVIRVRCRELYLQLCPQYLWRPFRRAVGRAWYVLGEAGVAFLHEKEVPQAGDWLIFALNVFYHCYPVWSDNKGGWHEGLAAYRKDLTLMIEWAETLRRVLKINPYIKPFFSQAGYFPFYMQVPGTRGGGFGEGSATLESVGNVNILAALARETNNPSWQWYVNAHGDVEPEDSIIGFIHSGALPIEGKNPVDLPTSRLFPGVGIAALNSTLLGADRNVTVHFKSSPMGSAGEGYEAQNSFVLYAFGKRFLTSSNVEGTPSPEFRRTWLYQTKSTNCITVEGVGQLPHDWNARGSIQDFADETSVAYVRGEAGAAYAGGLVEQFTRHVILLKGAAVILWDEVSLAEPRRLSFHLHAPVPFTQAKKWGKETYEVVRDRHTCLITFLWEDRFTVETSDKPDTELPSPEAIKGGHLRAATTVRQNRYNLVTLMALEDRQEADPYSEPPAITRPTGGIVVTYRTPGGEWDIVLRTGASVTTARGVRTGKVTVEWTPRGARESTIKLVRPATAKRRG